MSAPADRDPREVARRVLEIDERATKGPWRHDRDVNGVDSMIVQPRPDLGDDIVVCGSVAAPFSNNFEDGDLIAHYRTAAPLLAKSYLAALEAMRLAREALESALPALHSLKCRANDYEPCSCGSGLTGKRIDAALSALDAAMKEPKPAPPQEPTPR